MNLYVIGERPSLRSFLIRSGTLAAMTIFASLGLRIVFVGSGWLEEYILGASALILVVMVCDYVARFPILSIETRLTGAQVEGAIRFAETSPLKGSELSKAINHYLAVQQEVAKQREARAKAFRASPGESVDVAPQPDVSQLAETIKRATESGNGQQPII